MDKNEQPNQDTERRETHSILRIGIVGVITIIALWIISILLIRGIYPDIAERGSAGDQFGAVNALFTGLAFLGVILTILLQRIELREQRREFAKATKAQESQAEELVRRNDQAKESAKADAVYTFYTDLLQRMERHNWNLMQFNLSPGFNIGADSRVAVVCLQHLNLLFFVWINRETVASGGNMDGWRNWVRNIIEGGSEVEFQEYGTCYTEILNNGDLYPGEFIKWLSTELNLGPDSFIATCDAVIEKNHNNTKD